MSDMKRSASMALRRSFPGPRICSWPANSERSRGRIRQARGGSAGSADKASVCRFLLTFLRPNYDYFRGGRRGSVIVDEIEESAQEITIPGATASGRTW